MAQVQAQGLPQGTLRAPGEKKDDDEYYSPFTNLNKSTVSQETRSFNDAQLNVRKCHLLLTKILYILNQGDTFSASESTDVFFNTTKLFLSKNTTLRRMVYLVLKEMHPSSSEVIIVMSSLTKDMTCNNDLYRANSIRVLCRVMDTTFLGQIERYLKQAIVDKNPYVASSALISGSTLMAKNAEVVKRWVNEVQEVVNSKAQMVQFHGLALLYQIKQHDRLAVSKVVNNLTRSSLRPPLAQCLLIRYASKVLEEDPSGSDRNLYDFLESCLRHRSDMVMYEAARAICDLPNVTPKELSPAITVLQLLLVSPRPVLRFAAVRALNKVAMTHPVPVATCNADLEALITDTNRSIATLSITTLLKTGNENSVERFLKQISHFMSEIADEFKVVVVEAIKVLCLKFPQKHRILMNFLSTNLREEGGFEFKRAIVDAVCILINEIPGAKEAGLSHLCEFIEDCEFNLLNTQILNLLGREGPHTGDPAKFIRFIYNRIILENPSVRASAVSALAKFGAQVPSLRPAVITLLKRSLYDIEDETRDRATFFLNVLETEHPKTHELILGSGVPISKVQYALKEYKQDPSPTRPFDLSFIPDTTPDEVEAPRIVAGVGLPRTADKKAEGHGIYSDLLSSVPQLAKLGPLMKSSKPVELTESETEYVVNCVKHTFRNHIVFQFNCANTLSDQVLENVTVKMDLSDVEGFIEESVVAAPSLPFEGSGVSFVCLKREESMFPVGSISNTLKFTVKDVDPQTGEPDEEGYEDEYLLEEIEVVPSDFMKRSFVPDFRRVWEGLHDAHELVEAYGLRAKTLQNAASTLIDVLEAQPCEGTDEIPSNAKSHTLLLHGLFLGTMPVAIQAKLNQEQVGVTLKISIRSEDENVIHFIASAIA